jgi:hypothetical protein
MTVRPFRAEDRSNEGVLDTLTAALGAMVVAPGKSTARS